jgi:two-component system, NtrC family, sensor kinase
MTLLGVVAVFTALSFVILRTIIAPAFDDLEMEAAATDVLRVEGAMQTSVDNLAAITADWAPWDDIFFYVRGENPAFQKSNLTQLTLENLDIDILAVFTQDGSPQWSMVLLDEVEHPTSELGILNIDNAASSKLVHHSQPVSRTVQTGLGPVLISSRPIIRSDDTGPVSGAIVMGQFLNEERLRRLKERTEIDVAWLFANDAVAASMVPEISEISLGDMTTQVSDTTITSYKMFPDINGDPLLLIQTTTPRKISALGTQTVNAGLLFLGIAGVLVTIVMWFLLRHTILSPLESLAVHISRIRKSGDLTHRSGLDADDEIGLLARQFDSMTKEVHDARQALLDQSFKAGKADTAAEVMHNIRNAMTPMINGLERLSRSFGAASDLRVEDAISELTNPNCAPERREKFLQYLDVSFKHLEGTSRAASDDLEMVTAQARQVEAILSDQERFANVAPVTEDLPVNEVVSEAAHVIPKGAKPAVHLDIDESLADFHVCAHKTGLLQVLGNLILNAFESIQRAEKDAGKIQLRASDTVLDDKPMIRLTVRDNGRGFSQEIGKRIFQRGFTSKDIASSNGLGLHWCANAVAGMGGRISAESRGEGLGAEFHVLLPAAQGA